MLVQLLNIQQFANERKPMSVPIIPPFSNQSYLAQGVSQGVGQGVSVKQDDVQIAFPDVAQGKGQQSSSQEGSKAQLVSKLMSSETIAAIFNADKQGSMDTGIVDNTPQAPTAGDIAKEKFVAYMQMRPEELFFTLKLESKLQEMGMTMEQFEALPPEEQEKIIAEVKAEITEEARKRAEQKVEEARLAHSAQQAAKDLQPDSAKSEDNEEKVSELEKLAMRLSENNKAEKDGRDPLDFKNLTRAEIEKAGNELFRNGEITLEELFRFQHPDGKLMKVNGQGKGLNPNDPIDFVAATKQAIIDMEETGHAQTSPHTYDVLKGLYDKLTDWTT